MDPTSDSGASYVFVRSTTTWTQQKKLTISDKTRSDYMGSSVALTPDGNLALIGVPGKNLVPKLHVGAAYLFRRTGTAWSEQGKMFATDPEEDDYLGNSAAISSDGSTAIVGSDVKANMGAAYVFSVGIRPTGASCVLAGECVSNFCVDGFCCDKACGGDVQTDCQACAAARKASGQGDGICGPALANVVCRPKAGICDQEETCQDLSGSCPADSMLPAGIICRMSSGPDDAAEVCTGQSPTCPDEPLAPVPPDGGEKAGGCACTLLGSYSGSAQIPNLIPILLAATFLLARRRRAFGRSV